MTFISFVINGLVPLVPYIVDVAVSGSKTQATANGTFAAAIVLSAVVMFVMGAITSRFTPQRWLVAGFFSLLNGAVAAGVSYLMAFIVKSAGIDDSC